MATLTLTAAADTDIEETNPATNYGNEGSLLVGEPSGSATRSLIKFTTSSLPSDATLVSVVLRIYATNEVSSIADISVYGILRDWVEDEATWNKYDSSHTWTAAGCDVGSDLYATSSGDISASVTTGWVEISLTATVANLKSWYGFHLRLTGAYADEQLAFSSSEGSNPPQLVITYSSASNPVIEPFLFTGRTIMAIKGQSLTVSYLAWDTAAAAGATGDASNHAMRFVKDGTVATPANTPTEVDATNAPGLYKIVLNTTDTNCSLGTLMGVSNTDNVVIVPVTVDFQANLVAMNGNTTTVDHLKQDIDDGYERGTVDADGTSGNSCTATNTVFCTTLTVRATNGYKDQAVQFMDGTLKGEARHIESSRTVGDMTELTVYSDRPLPSAPADGVEVWVTGCLQPRETA